MLPYGIIKLLVWYHLVLLLFLGGRIMNIKTELLKNHIIDFIKHRIEDFNIDASEISDTSAINMLAEIQKVIMNETFSDFEVVEEIVCIFEKYNIDFGSRHDF